MAFNTNEPGLLYGKYPIPVLKFISSSFDIDKDFNELTVSDLEKVTTLRDWRMKGDYPDLDYYGFEPDTEYDFSILLEMPNLSQYGHNGKRTWQYS